MINENPLLVQKEMDESKSQFIYIKPKVRPRNVYGRSQVASGFILGTVLGGLHGCLVWANLPRTGCKTPTTLVNHIVKYGGSAGRAGGILTLMYAGFGTALAKYRGIDDEANTVLSATATGYLYSCTSGFHYMLYGGALGLSIGMGLAVHNAGFELIYHWMSLTGNLFKRKTSDSHPEGSEEVSC